MGAKFSQESSVILLVSFATLQLGRRVQQGVPLGKSAGFSFGPRACCREWWRTKRDGFSGLFD